MFGLQTIQLTEKKTIPATIFGWCMYDWANSAHNTTAVGLLSIYFAATIVGPRSLVRSEERRESAFGTERGGVLMPFH